MTDYQPLSIAADAAATDVGALFRSIAAGNPQKIALQDGTRKFTYQELDERTNSLANVLLNKYSLKQGDRIAVMSHNCAEYFELELAAAKAGVILVALNWRLTDKELEHCLHLTEPKLIVTTGDTLERLQEIVTEPLPSLVVGDEYERQIARMPRDFPDMAIDPEAGLVILFTSGTTGLPKGALISHRAMIARAMTFHTVFRVPPDDNFIAWTPMYHMVATDHGLATLMSGGTVWCIDGYQPELLAGLIENHRICWFVMVPGMVGDFVAFLKGRTVKPKGIHVIGAMADLVPRDDIAEATALLGAPYLNTFGATETGLAPATGGLIAIGESPLSLSKTQTPFCDLRLVDPEDREVPIGEPGEVSVTGPTLFSGYWNNDDTNRKDFRGGRFHMGDVLRRNADGTLDYVDRVKYLIKSGGENIYPAEIEQVLMTDDRIETAVVIRKQDQKWGEVPVAMIVRRDESLTEQEVLASCRQTLAGYKIPKGVYFIRDEDLPRSTTGKIQRHLLEQALP